jgi:hypothetical protein
MSVETSDLYLAVHWAARASALLFALALVAPAVLRSSARPSQNLFAAFIVAHTVHFFFVTWLAAATGGAGMFPGGRSVTDVGGWPAVAGIFALFYALAILGLAARRERAHRHGWLRATGRFATAFIGFMFVATYVPLLARSPWYALPAAIVTVAVVVDAIAGKLRRLRCFTDAASDPT